jgi:uncharacterized protein involved in type VI secretion and phage assembly
MTTLLEAIQGIAEHKLNQMLTCEIGQVTSVFPHADDGDFDNYECNVGIAGLDGELRRVPVATPHIGTASIPNVGDLVLVAFVRGDVNQPVVVGRLYNDEDRPPANKPDEIIQRLPLHAEDTEVIQIELRKQDGDPAREVLISLADKIQVRIVDTEITAQAGKTRLTISQPGDSDGVITVEAGKSKLTIKQDGDVLLESAGAMSLKASGDLSLTASNISLKSDMATKIEAGTEANVKAGTTAKFEASATMDIKGAMVNIN